MDAVAPPAGRHTRPALAGARQTGSSPSPHRQDEHLTAPELPKSLLTIEQAFRDGSMASSVLNARTHAQVSQHSISSPSGATLCADRVVFGFDPEVAALP